jgi:lysophospholipase L1-like esterase
MAFLGPHAWGAKIEPKNCPADVRAELDLVRRHANRQLWTKWKGPAWGNEGSTKTDWLVAHIDEWQKKLEPEVAVVLFGTNDIGQIPPQRYTENLEQALKRMMDSGTVPILTTPPPKSGSDAAKQYRDAAAGVARKLGVPLIDFYGEILQRRPNDWDGRLEEFARPKDVYDVPTLIAADGVHPSNSKPHQNDFSPEALRSNGYNLRNYLTLRAYARVIREVLAGDNQQR